MKVIKISSTKVECPTATAVMSKNNKDPRFKIILGSEGDGVYPYMLGLDTKYFKPTDIEDKVILEGDNYIIKEVKSPDTKKPMVLPDGKKLYTISKSSAHTFPKDTIVIWEIPNSRYTDVEYEISGDVEKLVEGGSIGKIRNGIAYTSPTLVLEVFGDCELKWTALNKENKRISQTVKYSYDSDEYKISSIEIVKGEK